MCSLSTFLSHIDNTFLFFFLPTSFGRFQQESYVGMWGHYGYKIVKVFLEPFSKVSSSTTDILRWYRPFFMEDCAPTYLSRELVLVAPYLCFRFCIFNKPVLEEYLSQVDGGSHLL
jgi:hypothetical protein